MAPFTLSPLGGRHFDTVPGAYPATSGHLAGTIWSASCRISDFANRTQALAVCAGLHFAAVNAMTPIIQPEPLPAWQTHIDPSRRLKLEEDKAGTPISTTVAIRTLKNHQGSVAQAAPSANFATSVDQADRQLRVAAGGDADLGHPDVSTCACWWLQPFPGSRQIDQTKGCAAGFFERFVDESSWAGQVVITFGQSSAVRGDYPPALPVAGPAVRRRTEWQRRLLILPPGRGGTHKRHYATYRL